MWAALGQGEAQGAFAQDWQRADPDWAICCSREERVSLRQEDDLLSPSLQAVPDRSSNPPWPLGRQIWVAFFGGTLAVTGLAYFNSRRLNASRRVRLTILAIGAAALLITLALELFLLASLQPESNPVVARFARYANRAVALIAYLFLERAQRSADRIHRFSGGEYSSGWTDLVGIIIGLGGLQFVLTLIIGSLVIL